MLSIWFMVKSFSSRELCIISRYNFGSKIKNVYWHYSHIYCKNKLRFQLN